MTYPFGVDTSKWQANKDGTLHMDWNKAKAAGIQFAFIRASRGSDYIDPEFARNWSEARRLSILRGAYHYFNPLQSVSQIKQFIDFVDPQADELLVLDLENGGGLDKFQLTLNVINALDVVKSLIGKYPIVYSRASWLDSNVFIEGHLPKLDYWLAQYYLAMPPPFFTKEYPTEQMRIPRGVTREQIKFHQSGEKGNGKMYGAQSYYIDTDRFIGTEELSLYFGANVPPVISPEVKPLFQARVITTPPNRLRTRYKPSPSLDELRPESDWLQGGQIVDVVEISGLYYRVGVDKWCASVWLSRLDTQPPVDISLLNVPVFSQNDPRWKDLRLGTSSTTIGWNGCLISTQCSVAGYFGFDLNPASFNAWLTGHAGYTNGNLYNWDSLGRLYPLEIATWIDCYNIPAPLNKIDEALARGEPCVVHVDFIPSTNIVNDHYITIDGKLPDGDYHIVDSWDGWRGSFKSRYVNPERYIYRIVSYRRR